MGKFGVSNIEIQIKLAEIKTVNLRKMKSGQRGIISAVRADGEMGRRIREMGLIKGSEVFIQGRAPLYDPVAIRIKGFTLTLRNTEADFIDVEVDE